MIIFIYSKINYKINSSNRKLLENIYVNLKFELIDELIENNQNNQEEDIENNANNEKKNEQATNITKKKNKFVTYPLAYMISMNKPQANFFGEKSLSGIEYLKEKNSISKIPGFMKTFNIEEIKENSVSLKKHFSTKSEDFIFDNELKSHLIELNREKSSINSQDINYPEENKINITNSFVRSEKEKYNFEENNRDIILDGNTANIPDKIIKEEYIIHNKFECENFEYQENHSLIHASKITELNMEDEENNNDKINDNCNNINIERINEKFDTMQIHKDERKIDQPHVIFGKEEQHSNEPNFLLNRETLNENPNQENEKSDEFFQKNLNESFDDYYNISDSFNSIDSYKMKQFKNNLQKNNKFFGYNPEKKKKSFYSINSTENNIIDNLSYNHQHKVNRAQSQNVKIFPENQQKEQKNLKPKEPTVKKKRFLSYILKIPYDNKYSIYNDKSNRDELYDSDNNYDYLKEGILTNMNNSSNYMHDGESSGHNENLDTYSLRKNPVKNTGNNIIDLYKKYKKTKEEKLNKMKDERPNLNGEKYLSEYYQVEDKNHVSNKLNPAIIPISGHKNSIAIDCNNAENNRNFPLKETSSNINYISPRNDKVKAKIPNPNDYLSTQTLKSGNSKQTNSKLNTFCGDLKLITKSKVNKNDHFPSIKSKNSNYKNVQKANPTIYNPNRDLIEQKNKNFPIFPDLNNQPVKHPIPYSSGKLSDITKLEEKVKILKDINHPKSKVIEKFGTGLINALKKIDKETNMMINIIDKTKLLSKTNTNYLTILKDKQKSLMQKNAK